MTRLLETLPAPDGRLGADVEALARLFSRIAAVPAVRIRLEHPASRMCPALHVDAVRLRLLCTYAGRGTEWEDGHGTIRRMPIGHVGLFKGTRWPGCDVPVRHRSPAGCRPVPGRTPPAAARDRRGPRLMRKVSPDRSDDRPPVLAGSVLDLEQGRATTSSAAGNDGTSRETIWRRFDGDDWAAFDRLPPVIRRRIWEQSYDVWSVNALMLWKHYRLHHPTVERAERALVRYLDHCERLERRAYASTWEARHGTKLPHDEAGVSVLR